MQAAIGDDKPRDCDQVTVAFRARGFTPVIGIDPALVHDGDGLTLILDRRRLREPTDEDTIELTWTREDEEKGAWRIGMTEVLRLLISHGNDYKV